MLNAQNVDSNTSAAGVGSVVRRNVTLAERLWNLDWSRELPWNFDGIAVERSCFDEIEPFVSEHYPTIFASAAEGSRFLSEPLSEAKRRFWDETDVFAFRFEGRLVGICAAHPSDWSTYYVRTFALLPEFRERRVLTDFEQAFSKCTRDAGIARWDVECSPMNTPVIRMFTGAGCVVTATQTSERWGAMLRFTKFLSEDAKAAYVRQFVSASPAKRKPK